MSLFRGARTARRVLLFVVGLVGATLSGTAVAVAQEVDVDVRACAEAYEQAQVTRNAGKLRESEEQLRLCVQDVCPDFVKVDCGQWLSDVRREMPSVILMVTDSAGTELKDVKVSIDNVQVASSLDGSALELNPGPHQVTFEYQGRIRTDSISIRQGEKNRVIKVEFASDIDTDSDGVPDSADRCPQEYGSQDNGGCPIPQLPAEASGSLSDLQVGTLVAGGVGVAGAATFAVFGIMAGRTAKRATDACKNSSCSDQKVLDYQNQEATEITIANIGAVVGGVGVVTGAVLFALSLDEPSEPIKPGDVSWAVAPAFDGGWLGLTTAF